jgi:hypothetical protein
MDLPNEVEQMKFILPFVLLILIVIGFVKGLRYKKDNLMVEIAIY